MNNENIEINNDQVQATTEVVKQETTENVVQPEVKEVSGAAEQQATEESETTEDKFQKELQSAKSKAKLEIMQELGIKSVKDFKERYQEIKQESSEEASRLSTLESELQNAHREIEKLNEDKLLTKYDINDELKDEFLLLAKSKVSDDISLEDAIASTLEKLPNFSKSEAKKNIQLGVEKVLEPVKTGLEYSTDALQQYPWLKK